MTHLPFEFSVRSPTLGEAQAVVDLINTNILEEFGEADYTLGDLLSAWQRPDFSLATDAWVVLAPDGTLAGYTSVRETGERVRIEQNTSVGLAYRERGLEVCLLSLAEEWARERIARGGSREIVQVVNDRNPWKAALLSRAGYAPVRQAWIMEIEMDARPTMRPAPEGIRITPFHPATDEREAHAAIQEAFRDVWGHMDESFEDWQAHLTGHQDFAPAKSFLAREGECLAGAIVALHYPNGGWIEQVAVRRPWRKRGLGLALMQQTFEAFYRDGVNRVQLSVDAESLTGATRLYTRAGMHPVRQFTRYAKSLRAGEE